MAGRWQDAEKWSAPYRLNEARNAPGDSDTGSAITTSALCTGLNGPLLPVVCRAANGRSEPKVTNTAWRSNVRYLWISNAF